MQIDKYRLAGVKTLLVHVNTPHTSILCTRDDKVLGFFSGVRTPRGFKVQVLRQLFLPFPPLRALHTPLGGNTFKEVHFSGEHFHVKLR